MIRMIINMDCCVYTCMIFHTFYLKKNGSRKTENEVNLQGRTLSTLRLASGEFPFKFSSEIAPGRRPLGLYMLASGLAKKIIKFELFLSREK